MVTETLVALDGHIVTEGPLTLIIDDIEEVTEYDKPVEVKVTISNKGNWPLTVQLQIAGLVDEWYTVGKTEKKLQVEAGKKASVIFHIAAGKGALSALYPVHVYATVQYQANKTTTIPCKIERLHAVQIFKSNFPREHKKQIRDLSPMTHSLCDEEQATRNATQDSCKVPFQQEELRHRARHIIKSQSPSNKNEFVFKLKDCTAAVVLGKNGLIDSAIAFGQDERNVVFDGLNIWIMGHKVGQQQSSLSIQKVNVKEVLLEPSISVEPAKLIIEHRLLLGQEEFDLTAQIWKQEAGLRIKLQCPKRITDIAIGQADQKAPRIYYGHGYCIVEPQSFTANFGGYNLSTSHVGFDFEKGISLLMACDNPPDLSLIHI